MWSRIVTARAESSATTTDAADRGFMAEKSSAASRTDSDSTKALAVSRACAATTLAAACGCRRMKPAARLVELLIAVGPRLVR